MVLLYNKDMRKFLIPLLTILILGGAAWGISYYSQDESIDGGVINQPTDNNNNNDNNGQPGQSVNTTGLNLSIPNGFSIETFAKNLSGARVIEFDGFGNMWVSQTSAGQISTLELENGKVKRQNAVFRNLRQPHGLAFEDSNKNLLYFVENHQVTRVALYSDDRGQKILDLPSGGGHFTRTLLIKDGKLYISAGSSCNVCRESDNRRATIMQSNLDGSGFKIYATGLRNSVFMAIRPQDGKMWATENGRDNLGDNIPPDEINIIEEGRNYGWPTCFGKNIHDDNFDKNVYIRNPCMEPYEAGSHIDIQAHSATLGLAFIPDSWPAEYRGDLLVALHGSWNRTVPTGYKIIRVKLDANGNSEGIEDFISGWHTGRAVLGRPVDVKFDKDGNLFVSDDRAGVIYRVWPVK